MSDEGEQDVPRRAKARLIDVTVPNAARVADFLRGRAEVTRWFGGLELVEPGIVDVDQWRPDPCDRLLPGGMPLLGAVARKP